MVVEPAATPKTSPDTLPILATPVLELVHVPPDVPLVSVIDPPAHTLVMPLIAELFTVTVVV